MTKHPILKKLEAKERAGEYPRLDKCLVGKKIYFWHKHKGGRYLGTVTRVESSSFLTVEDAVGRKSRVHSSLIHRVYWYRNEVPLSEWMEKNCEASP